jgi:undecaprenyl-diphosphatase
VNLRQAVRWWPAVALVAALFLGMAIAWHPGPLPGEVGYVRWLQRLPEPAPSLAEFVRDTTGSRAALVALVPLAAWVGWRRPPLAALSLLIAVAAILVVQPLAKNAVDRPRPTSGDVEVRATWTSESWPSGHSLGTTAVSGTAAALAWSSRRRGLAGLLALPVALTGFSSGIQGVHWPSDALGGMLIGALTAWLVLRAMAHLHRRRPVSSRR